MAQDSSAENFVSLPGAGVLVAETAVL